MVMVLYRCPPRTTAVTAVYTPVICHMFAYSVQMNDVALYDYIYLPMCDVIFVNQNFLTWSICICLSLITLLINFNFNFNFILQAPQESAENILIFYLFSFNKKESARIQNNRLSIKLFPYFCSEIIDYSVITRARIIMQ